MFTRPADVASARRIIVPALPEQRRCGDSPLDAVGSFGSTQGSRRSRVRIRRHLGATTETRDRAHKLVHPRRAVSCRVAPCRQGCDRHTKNPASNLRPDFRGAELLPYQFYHSAPTIFCATCRNFTDTYLGRAQKVGEEAARQTGLIKRKLFCIWRENQTRPRLIVFQMPKTGSWLA